MMIDSKIVSLFLLEHDKKIVFDHKLHLSKEIMHSSEPEEVRFQHV